MAGSPHVFELGDLVDDFLAASGRPGGLAVGSEELGPRDIPQF